MRQHFHPLDKSPRARYWAAHDQVAQSNQAVAEMMGGPRPLTEEELGRLAKMHPERWGRFRLKRRVL